MLIADALIDMNTADANGTTLTTTILNNGIQAGQAYGVWSIVGTASSLKIGASSGSGSDRLDDLTLRVNGTAFLKASTHRPIQYDHVVAATYVMYSFAGNRFAASVGGYITFGAANAGASGVLFDLVRLDNLSGDYCALQLNNGNAPGTTYGVNLETNPGGVTTHSSYLTVTPGSTHLFSLFFDSFNATATLKLWDITGVTLELNVTGATNSGHTALATLRIGNAEAGTSTGTTKFENLYVDVTKAQNPLGPTGSANFWVQKSNFGGHRTSASSVAVVIPSVALGDLVVVGAKWEGGATTATCSDGTNSLTVTSVGVVNNGGTAGDPHEVMFYTLSSLKSGSVTYTITFGAARVELDIAGMAFTPPSGLPSIALDGTAHAGTATSGTAVDSGNQTTTGTNGVSCAFGAGFGSNFIRPKVNSVLNDYFDEVGASVSAGFSAMWATLYGAGFTSSASATLTAGNNWDAQIVSFNAAASGGVTVTYPELERGIRGLARGLAGGLA